MAHSLADPQSRPIKEGELRPREVEWFVQVTRLVRSRAGTLVSLSPETAFLTVVLLRSLVWDNRALRGRGEGVEIPVGFL